MALVLNNSKISTLRTLVIRGYHYMQNGHRKLHIGKLNRTDERYNLLKPVIKPRNILGQFFGSTAHSDNDSNICNIWVSESTDIFANLALEHWLYTQKSTKINHLIFWKNDPCVVIGRHQNPWAECNVHSCEMNNVHVARRNSGGGAVYHDPGNVCVSFFTPRDGYSRHKNLQVIVDAVIKRWPIDLAVNDRDDIILEGLYKISGTAAKLGRITAYHHCTLLLDVDKRRLNHFLSTEVVGLLCNATESVRANVKNLQEVDASISFSELVRTISEEYCELKTAKGLVTYVDPKCEERFPGIGKIEEELKSWEWIFGRTPKFNIQRTFIDPTLGLNGKLELVVDVDKGCFSQIEMGSVKQHIKQNVKDLLLGKRFKIDAVNIAFRSGAQAFRGEDAKIYTWIWRSFLKLFTL